MTHSPSYSSTRWLVLVATCVATAALQSNMLSFAPLLGEIAKTLKINMGFATHLMTAFMLPTPFAMLLGGALCDRFGVNRMVAFCACGAALTTVIMPFIGQSFVLVLTSRFFQGVFTGFLLAAPAPLMAFCFSPQERGLVGGLIVGSVSLGGALGLLGAPMLFIALGSWQLVPVFLSIPAWMAFILILTTSKASHVAPMIEAADGRGQFKHALVQPITWIGILIVFFGMWCMQGLMNMIPSYLAVDKPTGLGFGPLLSGKISMALTISGVIAPVVGGLLLDKVFHGSSRPLIIIGYIIAALFAYPILASQVSSTMIAIILCLIMAGAGASMMQPAIATFVAGFYPPHVVGKMMGLWMGVGSFGAVIGMFVSGLLVAKYGNYTMAITLISVSAVVGCLFAFFLSPPKKVLATVNVKGEAS